MVENIKLEIVAPERSVIDELARIVMAPGVFGEFGVLFGHTPFLTVLKTGVVRFSDVDGQDRFVFVSCGFAEVSSDKVVVLAEAAEESVEIDIDRAKAAESRAKNRLLKLETGSSVGVDFERARFALLRAIERIRLVEGL